MSVRASRVSIPLEVSDAVTFRAEGDGVLVASGAFGSPLNLSSIGPNDSPIWADNVRQGRAQVNLFIEGRSDAGTCSFTIKLGNDAALSDPSVIMGPIEVPANYAGLVTVGFDLEGQGLVLSGPLWCGIEITLSGGAVCGGHAWLGPRMK